MPATHKRISPAGLLTVITVAVGAIAGGGALAHPEYRLQAIKQLHLVPDTGGQVTVDCTFCHVNKTGGAPWNPFGQRVQAALSGDFPNDLYKVLAANADSDGDGYEDVLEVFAGTRPGDKNDRPLVDKAFLRKNFEAAGGLKLYKP